MAGVFDRHHVLIVGIGEYKNKRQIETIDAGSDASMLHKCLLRIGYQHGQLHPIVDEQASQKVIREKVTTLTDIEDAELLLICWSGHAEVESGTTYLLPYDADLRDLDGTALDVAELHRMLGRAHARHIGVVLDTCHSRASSQRLRRIAMNPQTAANGRSVAFLGASTRVSRGDLRGGGVVTNSLMDVLWRRNQALSAGGIVNLDTALVHAYHEVRRRTAEAWHALKDPGPAPEPYFELAGNRPVAVGLHVPDFLRSRLTGLREPARSLTLKLGDYDWFPGEKEEGKGKEPPAVAILRPLADVAVPLAHGAVPEATALQLYCDCVREVILTWSLDPLLQPFVHRLLYYLLMFEEPDRRRAANLVEWTQAYMLGQCERWHYVERLQQELQVLDRFNTTPWAYGVRVRKGARTDYFQQLVPADVAVPVGSKFECLLYAPVDHGPGIVIDIFRGHGLDQSTAGGTHVVQRKISDLPALPAGTTVAFTLTRVSAAGMELTLTLRPNLPDRDQLRWTFVDPTGFRDLVAHTDERTARRLSGEGRVLRLLLDDCARYIARSSHALDESTRRRLNTWIDTAALVLHSEQDAGMRPALELLVQDLKHAEVPEILSLYETLLTGLAASPEENAEFRRVAESLRELDRRQKIAELDRLVFYDDLYKRKGALDARLMVSTPAAISARLRLQDALLEAASAVMRGFRFLRIRVMNAIVEALQMLAGDGGLSTLEREELKTIRDQWKSESNSGAGSRTDARLDRRLARLIDRTVALVSHSSDGLQKGVHEFSNPEGYEDAAEVSNLVASAVEKQVDGGTASIAMRYVLRDFLQYDEAGKDLTEQARHLSRLAIWLAVREAAWRVDEPGSEMLVDRIKTTAELEAGLVRKSGADVPAPPALSTTVRDDMRLSTVPAAEGLSLLEWIPPQRG